MTEIQASAAEVLLKRKHEAFARHVAAAVEALVAALEEAERDRARETEALRDALDAAIQQRDAQSRDAQRWEEEAKRLREAHRRGCVCRGD